MKKWILFVYLPVFAFGGNVAQAAGASTTDHNVVSREYYYFMVVGARKDAKDYRAIQTKLADAARKLTSQGKLSPQNQRRVEVYKEVHGLYGELIDWHESIEKELSPENSMTDMRRIWDAIVALEAKVKELTKKDVVRSWVTKAEIKQLQADGRKKIFEKKGRRYPFLREHWMNKEEYQKMQMKKASEARKRAEATAEKK